MGGFALQREPLSELVFKKINQHNPTNENREFSVITHYQAVLLLYPMQGVLGFVLVKLFLLVKM